MSEKIYKKLIDQFVYHFSTIFENSANTFKDIIYFLNNSIY